MLFLAIVLPISGQEVKPCTEGVYKLVAPFMGHWEEYNITDDGEEFIGTLSSSRGPDGCTIGQRFVSADGSFSYQSFGYVEADSQRWKEIYVFSNGNNSEYQWFSEGEDVIMRRTGGSRQLEYMHQLRLTNIQEGFYDVIEEHSYDNGLTWKHIELTRIKRIENNEKED